MIQLTAIYAIELPKDAERFEFSIQGDGVTCLTYWHGENIDPDVVCLPPGNWHFLGTSTDITEEQATTVVTIREANGYPIGYKDYQSDDESYRNAIDSFHSLLRSKGLGRVAIIKKV
jgi:hypothetical protein